MPRKSDDISMGYRIEALPGPVSKRKVYQILIRAARHGGKLPAGWKVVWSWRNTAKQSVRSAPFEQAVRKSRAGFLSLIERRLARDAERVIPGFSVPALRKATKGEERAIERAEEESEERRREKKPGEATRKRKRAEFLRRSEAAKKGWVTRRRHMREKARKKAGRKRG